MAGRAFGAGLVLALLAGWAAAQTPPAPAPAAEESAFLDELAPVVVKMPGPALWKVAKGDSQVIILGYFQPLPHALDWPKGRLVAALNGAHAVLVPPDPRFSPMDALSLTFSLGAIHNPGGKTLKDVTTPSDYDRFQTYAALAQVDMGHYAHWRPLIAATALITDVRKVDGLSSAKPVSTVTHLAKDKGVMLRTVGHIGLSSVVRNLTRLTPSQEQACFRAALDELDWETRVARRAGDVWAAADIEGLRALRPPHALEDCAEDLPGLKKLIDQETSEAASTLEDALSRPGKVVALVDMRYLDRQNGLLDRLRARGATISVPN